MSTPYVTRRRILFGDCDPGGIVYTPRIGHFVVEAVLEFLRVRLGEPAERRLFELGIGPPARALSIEFLKPMAWDDELEVSVAVKELRNSAMVFSVSGAVNGHPTFTAEITQVCVEMKTMRPVPVPDDLRAALLRSPAR